MELVYTHKDETLEMFACEFVLLRKSRYTDKKNGISLPTLNIKHNLACAISSLCRGYICESVLRETYMCSALSKKNEYLDERYVIIIYMIYQTMLR